MLPTIEVESGQGTAIYGDPIVGTRIVPLRFRINGHRFTFEGTDAERYALERDLNDARTYLNAVGILKRFL